MGGPGKQEQRPVFRADVDVVRLDVIATDAGGNFAADLTIDDFIVYEDGERQELLQVQLIDLRAGGERPADAGAPPETTARGGPAPGRTESPAGFGAMVFLIEARGFSPEARHRLVNAWEKVARNTASYVAPRAVYVIDVQGRLWEILPLTSDSAAVVGVQEAIERRLEPGGGTGLPGAGNEWGAALGIADRAATARSIEVLAALSRAFSFRPGRKSIVWISPGVRTTLSSKSKSGMIIPEALEQLQELTRLANSAGVSLYAIDPTLVTERYRRPGSSTRIESRTGPVEELLADPFDSRVTSFDALRDSLRVLARGTGGKAYPFTTKLGEAAGEVRDDSGRYYLLTYARPFEGDGEYHELRVETTRPDVSLRARGGYVDHSREQLALRRASSALAFPEIADAAELPFAAYASWTERGRPRLQLALDLGPWVDDLASRDDRQLQLAFSATDAAGRLVDENYELVSWNTGEGPRPSVYVHDWPLEYGRFEVRVAVVDRATLRVSAGRAVVEFAEPEDGWRVSQPVLLAPGPGGLPEAVVDAKRYQGSLTGVYFEVWSQEPPRVEASLEADAGTTLPSLVRELGADRFSVMVSLAGAPREAAGVVHIEVTNPATPARRRLEVDLRGREPRQDGGGD